MKKTKMKNLLPVYISLFVLMVIVLFPLIYTLLASLKSQMEFFNSADKLFPEKATLVNYKSVLTSDRIDLKTMLFNSTYYTICCVVINLIASAMNAYVFERGRFPGKKIIFTVFSSLMFINMGSITVYPLFDILNAIHLNRSLLGLIVIKLLGIPIVYIVLVRSYVATIPKELDEAAKIDGCSFFGIFWRIILPVLKPILATVGVLSFNASWNEYLMPSIFTLSNPKQQTLMVGIYALKSTGESAANWGLMLAAAVIALIPVLVAFIFGNRYFIDGITEGAVKG
ncbi:MAG: carbohydrate ABC transporter permease [Clostridia bacterium]|nr:carbohydrate ABC transporter permease [Clostridia bacterium]